MDWLLRIWIQIKIWWLQLLGKTVIDEKIINAVKEIESRVQDINLKLKEEKKKVKKKRGRKPKKK